jgi:hypothetical protein
MDQIKSLPDSLIKRGSAIADHFASKGIKTFLAACEYVHNMPYGYNSGRKDLMILFKEKKGTCITKHAVIAALAMELNLPVSKYIGIYAMTQTLVTGTDTIIDKYELPFVPMLHCFLSDGNHRVDLTEGNPNGKNGPINEFLFTSKVKPDISEREEYLIYRHVLQEQILTQGPLKETPLKTVLQAREEGLMLLKANLVSNPAK